MTPSRRLDELALNAWPAWQTVLLDGWMLRYAGGYTKRANSVNALYAGELPLEHKILLADDFYRSRGQPAVFRLAPFSRPASLEQALLGKGYELLDLTHVQTLELADRICSAPQGIESLGLSAWMDVYGQFAGQDGPTMKQHEALLGNIMAEHRFFVLRPEKRALSCGLAVVDGEHVGLFDVTTDPAERNRGHGRQLVEGMLAWARSKKARLAYLQVIDRNCPARRLYSGLGFETAYQYWYRRMSW